jgi:DNA-directed RNA polymerase, subunit H (EC 2.7.7.6)
MADPAVIALKANEGDILEITRASKTAGEAVYYRVVIR